ncbi:MAG: methyltransferase domain-containing protein [Chthoniobacterales bacterium]|nr:methyltransferase domain-containing protein [Chthoniobacterales bacterium]
MNQRLLDVYVCPVNNDTLRTSEAKSEEITHGELVSAQGARYPVREGIPSFLPVSLLSETERATQAEYDETAEQKYDAAVDWLFRSFYEDEDKVREHMLDLLHLKPDSRILEIGSGTGRDSFRIARRLGEKGEFFVQDLSEQMVRQTRNRLEAEKETRELKPALNYFASTARFLPFRDEFFDAVFHFGGFNNFSEPKATLAEMTRVVKRGGRVVFGDESLPPWLAGTEFGEMIVTNNPLFKHKVPLDYLPSKARDVTVRWVLGGCFYLIDFTVGDGPPPIDIDLPHEGWRGGTLRTRYHGRLEGVTPEAREMALAAAKKEGVSLHAWLDALVRRATQNSDSAK